MNGFVPKPIDAQELSGTLLKWLAAGDSAEQHAAPACAEQALAH